MSCTRLVTRVAAATAAVLAPIVAGASVVTVEFAGTVGFTGWDRTGVFGAPNTDLFGAPFWASFAFDTEIGSNVQGPYSQELLGGPQVGLPMPLLAGSITINGVTAPYTLDGWAYLLSQNDGNPRGSLQVVVQFYDPPLRTDIFNVGVNSPTIGRMFDTSFDTTDVRGGGNFQFRTDNPAQGGFVDFALGQLTVERLRFVNDKFPPQPVGVSEPPVLGIALCGLAALAVRRRRSSSGSGRVGRRQRDEFAGRSPRS